MLFDRSNEERSFRGMHNKIVESALKAKTIFILRDANVPKQSYGVGEKNRSAIDLYFRGDNKNKNIKHATPQNGAPQAFLDAPYLKCTLYLIWRNICVSLPFSRAE